MVETKAHPWERQPGESAAAFAAFAAYRDMGLTRSLTRTANVVRKNRSLIARWSGKHHWERRATAWDREADLEWQREIRERQRRAARANLDQADALQQKAAEGLESLPADKLKPLEVARLHDSAVKLQRAVLETTHGSSPNSTGGGSTGPTADDFEALTDEEILVHLQLLYAEIGAELTDAAELLGRDTYSNLAGSVATLEPQLQTTVEGEGHAAPHE